MTAAIFFGVMASFNPFGLGGAITVFTRRFLGLVRILVVGSAGPLLYSCRAGASICASRVHIGARDSS